MAKKYHLSSKSDMRRFSKDLEKNLKKVADGAIRKKGVEIDCPHCGEKALFRPGDNLCSQCSRPVTVNYEGL